MTKGADYSVSTYPFRFIPTGWSVSAVTKALRCSSCVDRRRFVPEFYEKNEVWLDYPRWNTTETDSMGNEKRVRADVTSVSHATLLHIRSRVMSDAQVALPDTVSPEGKQMSNDPKSESDDEQQSRGGGGFATYRPNIRLSDRATQDRKGRMKQQGSEMLDAFSEGLSLSLVNEVGEILVDIYREATSDIPMAQAVLSSPSGREAAKAFTAVLLHTGARQTDLLPQAEYIALACQKQMTASTFTLAGPRLNGLRKHFMRLAQIGEKTAPAAVRARVEDTSEEELSERYAQLQAEAEELRERLAEVEAKSKAKAAKK